MATDKLINQTQGADIIDALSDIATNVGNITYGPQTSADKVVSMTGYQKASAEAAISEGDTLNQAIGKLEKKADDNATGVTGKIDKLTNATAGDIATVTATGEIADSEVAIETTLSDSSDAKVPTSKAVGTYVADKGYAVGVNSSTANNLVAFNDANGRALKDSGIAVAKSSTGLTDSDTAVPTSKTVKTYVDSTATGISRYLGTITAASGLSTSAKKGDFYVVKTAWTGVHAGDEIIAEKDNPAQTIDGTNWSLLHNEADTDTKYTFATGDSNGTFKVTPSDTGTAQSVAIKGLGNAAYKGVADTVSTSTDLVTSAAVNTKLASYVPNSDFVVAEQNILYNAKTGAQNLIVSNDIEKLKKLNSSSGSWESNVFKDGRGTFTINDDGSITVNGTFSAQTFLYLENDGIISASRFKELATVRLFGCPTGGSESSFFLAYRRISPDYYWFDTGSGVDIGTISASEKIMIFIGVRANVTVSNQTFYPALVLKSIYNQDPNFCLGALPNSDLTILEAEDRAALAEEIDAGAKSLVPMTWTNADPFADIHMTKNSDGSITVTATNTAATRIVSLSTNINNYLTVGKRYVLSGCDGGDYFNHYGFALSTSDYTGRIFEANGCEEFTYASEVVNFTLVVRAGESWTKTFKPMICTKAAFGVSNKFVPYTKSNSQLTTELGSVKTVLEAIL